MKAIHHEKMIYLFPLVGFHGKRFHYWKYVCLYSYGSMWLKQMEEWVSLFGVGTHASPQKAERSSKSAPAVWVCHVFEARYPFVACVDRNPKGKPKLCCWAGWQRQAKTGTGWAVCVRVSKWLTPFRLAFEGEPKGNRCHVRKWTASHFRNTRVCVCVCVRFSCGDPKDTQVWGPSLMHTQVLRPFSSKGGHLVGSCYLRASLGQNSS